MDEFSSYAQPSLAAVFEQARAANICLFPFIQTMSSLSDKERGLSEDFRQKIVGNTWNKIAFILQDPESCEVMSSIAGETLMESRTESMSENISFAGGDDDVNPLRTGGRGHSMSVSRSYKYDAIVRPEDFRNLKPGEAIYMGRNRRDGVELQEVIKLRVPLLSFKMIDSNLDMPRFRMPHREGLGVAAQYSQTFARQ